MSDKIFVALTKEQVSDIPDNKIWKKDYANVELLGRFLSANNVWWEWYQDCTSGYELCSEINDKTLMYNAIWYDTYYDRYKLEVDNYGCQILCAVNGEVYKDLSKEWIETQYNAYGDGYLNVAIADLEGEKAQHTKALKEIDKKLEAINGLQNGAARG